MTYSQPPKIINILHAARAEGDYPEGKSDASTAWFEYSETNYYAVRQPADAWDHWHEGEEPDFLRHDSTSYAIFGGQAVHIHDQEDIDGLRKLLDAIEADLKESKK